MILAQRGEIYCLRDLPRKANDKLGKTMACSRHSINAHSLLLNSESQTGEVCLAFSCLLGRWDSAPSFRFGPILESFSSTREALALPRLAPGAPAHPPCPAKLLSFGPSSWLASPAPPSLFLSVSV